ncbi:MAG: hypothetical protein ABJ308_03470 [Halieaceae bacterium]
MFKQIVVSIALVFGAAAVSAEPVQQAEGLQPAKVIVYRADEQSKTRRINFNTFVGSERLGRVRYNQPTVSEVAPGEYELSSSIPGTDAVKVTLQPGQTYYVHAKVRRLGQTVIPEMVVVEEQVALTQQPTLEGII